MLVCPEEKYNKFPFDLLDVV